MSFVITRTVAPTFDPLSTEEISQWCRIDPDTDQITISMLMASATAQVEALTGQVVCQATFQILYDEGQDAYPVPLYPVVPTDIQAATILGAPVPLLYYQGSRTIILSDCAEGPLTLTLTAGYPSPDKIPMPIKHAIAVLISAAYDDREGVSDTVMLGVNRILSGQRRMAL